MTAGVFLAPNENPDLFWHLASAREAKALGLPFLDKETFSFTLAGADWINFEWLFSKLVYVFFEIGSFKLLAFLASLLSASIVFWVSWYSCHSSKLSGPKLFFGGIASIFIAVNLIASRANLQPELFGLLFLLIFFLLRDELLSSKIYSARFWLFLSFYFILFALWANIHSTFSFALATLGIQMAASLLDAVVDGYRSRIFWPNLRKTWPFLRRCAFLIAAGFAATLINPFGFGIYELIVKVVGDINLLQLAINEWQSAEFEFSLVFFWVYFVSGLALILMSGWPGKRLRLEALLFWMFCGCMVFEHVRNVAVFGIATLPYLITAYSEIQLKAGRWIKMAGTGILLMLTVLGARNFYATAKTRTETLIVQGGVPGPFVQTLGYPVRAFDFLDRNRYLFGLRAYLEWGWGGYAEWRAAEKGLKVFFDGRYLFHDLLDLAMTKAESPASWQSFLTDWQVNMVIRSTPKLDQYFVDETAKPGNSTDHLMRSRTALFYSPKEWALVYWDAVSLVLVRRSAVSSGFLKKHEYKIWAPLDFHAVLFGIKTGRIKPDQAIKEMRRNKLEAGDNFYNRYFARLAAQRF
ncbi:MAG: hypothetical protein HY401_05765 [Elusimicrobia bacterium]|nr:hypothetical protein [Elusimicrobiota bacterium]